MKVYASIILSFAVLVFFNMRLGAWTYSHPMTVINPSEAAVVKQRITAGTEPQKSAYSSLISQANAQLSFGEAPPATLDIPGGYVDADGLAYARGILARHSHAAYTLALAYYYSGNTSYAAKARDVLMAWANKNTTFTGGDAPLQLGSWFIGMLYGVDLLHNYSGWASADRAKYKTWHHDKVLAKNHANTYTNNWLDSALLGILAYGVAFEDDTEVSYAISEFDEYFKGTWKIKKEYRSTNGAEVTYLPSEVTRNEGSSGITYTAYSLTSIVQLLEMTRYLGNNWWERATTSSSIPASFGECIKWYYNWDELDYPFPWNSNPGHADGYRENPYELYNSYFGDNTSIKSWLNSNRPVGGLQGDEYITLNKGNIPIRGAIDIPPSITTHPSSKTAAAGKTATFSVSAAGTSPLTYQWKKNGTSITGATGSSYTTPVLALSDSGAKYKCTVSNDYGIVTSNEATLTVVEGDIFSSGTSWQNVSLASQSGQFLAEFDMKPLNNNMDGQSALSFGTAGAYSDLAAIIRFSAAGIIDARNGDVYQSDTSLAYVSGIIYHAAMAVNLATKRYSVTVTPEGGSAVVIASNYAFRTEQATITAINNFSVYASNGSHEVFNLKVSSTSAADTTPPSAPGTVRDGAVAGTDISSTTSRTQLSANWTQSADVESGISGYNYAIGTAQGGTNITNGWISNNTNTAVTKTGLSLVIGTTYYFSVKAVNGVSLQSDSTNSDGQVVISTAVPDTTAPSAPGTIRDGAVTGTDAVFTYSTTTLSANWTAAIDNESGISNYQFSIGTTPGATNITNWVTIGTALAVTKTGLTLTVGATYYFSVKATNGQGLTGNAGNSNGQYVKEVNTADTTPPDAISAVRDGISETDDPYTYLTTELSANWNSSADVESGISRYYFAIGTSPGLADITGWTDNGIETTVTQTGLNLTAGTTYYFSVKAENGIGLQSTPANSDGQYIISAVAQGPVISNIQAANITANAVTISWTTDKQATSQVEYGNTAVYGNLTAEDSNLVISHSMVITGLNPGQTYHYRAISKDGGDGNQSVSVDYTFTTLSTLNTQPSSNAYPNPYDFRNGQVIKFKVGSAGSEFKELKIYTLSGKRVRELKGESGAGEISWDGKNVDGQRVARGVYIYKIIKSNGDKITGKLAVSK